VLFIALLRTIDSASTFLATLYLLWLIYDLYYSYQPGSSILAQSKGLGAILKSHLRYFSLTSFTSAEPYNPNSFAFTMLGAALGAASPRNIAKSSLFHAG